MIQEIDRRVASGYTALVALIVAGVVMTLWMISAIGNEAAVQIILSSLGLTLVLFLFAGLFIVNPNEARVLQLFGKYVGTVKTPGLRFANPFYTKSKISVKVRNFETGKLKVND